MLNQIVMVGRIVKTPEIRETEEGKKVTDITLAVPRTYKNADGVYETDFLDITLWNGVAENTYEYCKQGDLIGVRGHIKSRTIEEKDGGKSKRMEIVADRVSFLSQAKEKETTKNEKERE